MRLGFTLRIVAGYAANRGLSDAAAAKAVAGYLTVVTDVFLRLIKRIIAPLVFSTLVTGIIHVGDSHSLSRLGAMTIAWFIGASLVSLMLGLVLVNALTPGAALGLPLPDASADVAIKGTALTLKDFVTHVVPRSFSRRWRPTRSCKSSCSRCSLEPRCPPWARPQSQSSISSTASS
jgi:Na+/H+-dicarboxylate symporter